MGTLIEGDMPDLKTEKEWVVLEVHGVMLVARMEDVLPKYRLSPPLTYEQAHVLKHLFR